MPPTRIFTNLVNIFIHLMQVFLMPFKSAEKKKSKMNNSHRGMLHYQQKKNVKSKVLSNTK